MIIHIIHSFQAIHCKQHGWISLIVIAISWSCIVHSQLTTVLSKQGYYTRPWIFNRESVICAIVNDNKTTQFTGKRYFQCLVLIDMVVQFYSRNILTKLAYDFPLLNLKAKGPIALKEGCSD